MRGARRGATAVEFALTLPVFLLCTLGAFDLVWLVYLDDTLALALDDACRDTALGDPAADLDAALDAELERSFAGFGLAPCGDCAVSATVEGAAPARRLSCQATRTATPVSGFLLGDLTLQAGTSAWMERQVP